MEVVEVAVKGRAFSLLESSSFSRSLQFPSVDFGRARSEAVGGLGLSEAVSASLGVGDGGAATVGFGDPAKLGTLWSGPDGIECAFSSWLSSLSFLVAAFAGSDGVSFAAGRGARSDSLLPVRANPEDGGR